MSTELLDAVEEWDPIPGEMPPRCESRSTLFFQRYNFDKGLYKKNPAIRGIREAIKTDPDKKIEFARGANTPSDIRRLLEHDPDEAVRLSLATNPHMQPDILQVLCQDLSPTVRQAAIRDETIV